MHRLEVEESLSRLPARESVELLNRRILDMHVCHLRSRCPRADTLNKPHDLSLMSDHVNLNPAITQVSNPTCYFELPGPLDRPLAEKDALDMPFKENGTRDHRPSVGIKECDLQSGHRNNRPPLPGFGSQYWLIQKKARTCDRA